MPSVIGFLARTMSLEDQERQTRTSDLMSIMKRISIPYNSSSPAGLIKANTRDPWGKSGKYALGWVYFSIILLIFTAIIRFYHLWTDKVRTALHQEDLRESNKTDSPATDCELSALETDKSARRFFPRTGALLEPPKLQSSVASSSVVNISIAVMRFVFYRPIPVVRWNKRFRPLVFPSPGVVFVVLSALIFVVLYCFIPQPLYWQSIEYGSPPLAIRAGMIAVAMMPWIVALGMKANMVSMLTGIGHERLNVLHRWLAYLLLLLSLIHMVPFYVTPIWKDGGRYVFTPFFGKGIYVYGSGESSGSKAVKRRTLTSERYRGSRTTALPLRPFIASTAT